MWQSKRAVISINLMCPIFLYSFMMSCDLYRLKSHTYTKENGITRTFGIELIIFCAPSLYDIVLMFLNC